MKLPHRRQFLHLAAGAAALPAASRIAKAQAYPTRPVRMIVPYPPGGVSDIIGRLIGQSLAERLGQPFIIENRAGAGSSIGTEAAVNAAPNGYTLLLAGSSNSINATFYPKLSYNFIRDTAPVATIIRAPQILEVNPSVPANAVRELIAYAKANPGKLNFASAGNGGLSHLAGELFKMMAGVDIVHVPYRGAALALTDMLGGQVQVMFDIAPSSIEHIRADRLRALAVTSPTRSEVLPDLPAVAEFVPGYEATNVNGVVAPGKTPADIVDRLNREINASLADPRMKARLADLGGAALAGSPADYGKIIADETEKWAKVVKFSGARAE
jgi:tripartite-type tricarboxylate transporter receptor subunit TctC